MVYLGPVNTPNRIEKISRAIDADRIWFETFEYRGISWRSSNTATKTIWRNRSAKTFSAHFLIFFSVLSKSRHEPNYTKLEKRQGKKTCLKYYLEIYFFFIFRFFQRKWSTAPGRSENSNGIISPTIYPQVIQLHFGSPHPSSTSPRFILTPVHPRASSSS